VLEVVALIAALASGVALAIVNLVMGEFITILINYVSGQSTAE
jgi:ATP-binding cassette, subfamily B (MDR/TAP), member 1